MKMAISVLILMITSIRILIRMNIRILTAMSMDMKTNMTIRTHMIILSVHQAHVTADAAEAPQGDKMVALLDYMLKHNEHHAAELDQVAENLRKAGKEAAAEQIKKAVDEFQKGNLYLGLALSSVKEN